MSRILLFFEKDSIPLTFHLQQLDEADARFQEAREYSKILE
jgi:hypothetical protein